MVNSSYLFTLQSRSNFFSSPEMNIAQSQTDQFQPKSSLSNLYKSDSKTPSRSVLSNPSHTPQPDFSPVTPVELSPAYMDVDTCFNYPARSKVTSHVMAEELNDQQSLVQEYFSQSAPKMERQYSINTVMEVIESHDINDTSTCKIPSNSIKPQPTQPINIEQPRVQDNQSYSSPQFTVLAPPASDVRVREGSVSSSPQTPFSAYRDNYSYTPHEPHSVVEYNYPCGTEGYSYHYTNQDLNPADQNPFSPYQSDTSSPMFQPASNTFLSDANDQVFSFDENIPGQFTQSHVSQNNLDQQRAVEVYTPHSSGTPGPSEQMDPITPFSYPTPTHSSISNSRDNVLANNMKSIKLEEVDSNSVFQDYPHDSTEQERADRRRMRNNMACRASRERRKKRKKDQEALAEYLADKNRKLKERIKQLEQEVYNVHAVVRRRMSQS